MEKIAVGMISVNCLVHWGVAASWINNFSHFAGGHNYEFKPIFKRGIYLDKLRNEVVIDFLASDCEYLLFLDYDNGFDVNAIDLFLEDILLKGAKIVSGVYYYREQDNYVAGFGSPFHDNGVYRKIRPGDFSEELVNLTKVMGTSGMIGFGCCMIRREVFETMDFPWFYTYWHPKLKQHVSEDTAFCQKAETYGFDIYLDQRIESPHMSGDKCYPPEWRPY